MHLVMVVYFLVLFLFRVGQPELLLLRLSLAGHCGEHQVIDNYLEVYHSQRQKFDANNHAHVHNRLHVHCDCLQLFPKILCGRGG